MAVLVVTTLASAPMRCVMVCAALGRLAVWPSLGGAPGVPALGGDPRNGMWRCWYLQHLRMRPWGEGWYVQHLGVWHRLWGGPWSSAMWRPWYLQLRPWSGCWCLQQLGVWPRLGGPQEFCHVAVLVFTLAYASMG